MQILKKARIKNTGRNPGEIMEILKNAVEIKAVTDSADTLPEMLEKASVFMEEDLQHTAGLLSQLLEPLIMLILGALIGTLVVAMYLPIFKLGTVI